MLVELRGDPALALWAAAQYLGPTSFQGETIDLGHPDDAPSIHVLQPDDVGSTTKTAILIHADSKGDRLHVRLTRSSEDR